MAAGSIGKPGSKYGPCLENCQHTDCADTRKIADSLCSICGTPIGYEVRFYKEKDGYNHELCLIKKIDLRIRVNSK